MKYRTIRQLKNVLVAAVVMSLGVIPVSAQDHASCPMMGKKEHRDEVDHRHDAVSGVRHEGAVHHFLLAPEGGTIRLETKDGSRPVDRDRIRQHLQLVARSFADGDFALPMEVHAQVPPGVETMKEMGKAITYAYSPTEKGGEIRLSTREPAALAAIHAFLRFQIQDHGTGDPIE
jgi:hypothetical protein